MTNFEAILEVEGGVKVFGAGTLNENQDITWDKSLVHGPIEVESLLIGKNTPTEVLKFLDAYAKMEYSKRKSIIKMDVYSN
jgi:hypothetical protein